MNIKEGTVINPLPNEELIAEKEKRWRITLPKDYKDFMLQYSGGIPVCNSFWCNNHNHAVNRFLCILKDVKEGEFGWYDISVVESQIGERLTDNEDLIGIEVLPIAELFAGDYLCIDYRKSKLQPSICVWSHEESGEFDPVTYWVAGSFEDFCKMLSE